MAKTKTETLKPKEIKTELHDYLFLNGCVGYMWDALVTAVMDSALWCVPGTIAWRVLKLQIDERPPEIEGSGEYSK